MKRVSIISLLLGFLGGSLSLYAKPIGVFTMVIGQVQAKEAGGRWFNVTPGVKFSERAEIQTGLKGQATLQLVNGTVLKMSSGSIFSIDRLVAGVYGTDTEASLQMGRVTAVISKTKSPDQRNYFSVKTPTAVAAVRGSIQEIGYSPENGTQVRMLEHAADMLNKQGLKVMVPQGGESRIDGSSVLTPYMMAHMDDSVVFTNGSMSSAEADFLYDASDMTFSSSASDFADFFDFFDSLFDDIYNMGFTKIDFEKL